MKSVVAIALLNQGDPNALLNVALQHIEVYRRQTKLMRPLLKGKASLPNFTLTVAAFKEQFPVWLESSYKDNELPATAMPVDVQAMKIFISQLACRSSKAGVATPARPTNLRAQMQMHLTQGSNVPSIDLPGFQLFEHARVRQHEQLQQQLMQLAPPTPLTPPPTPTSLANGASPPASPLSPLSPVSPPSFLQVNAGQLALTNELEEETGAKPAAPQPALQDKPDATPVAAGPTGMIASFHGMLKTAKEAAEEEMDDAAEQGDADADTKKKPAASLQVVMRKPAASLKRPASALPPGWRIETRVRKSGKSSGTTDKYYVAPDGGICRSLLEVNNYQA
jgi:hypothetical protein